MKTSEFLKKNQVQLIKFTKCSEKVIQKLDEKGLLNEEEKNNLINQSTPRYLRCKTLYCEILPKRSDWINTLRDILEETKQREVLNIFAHTNSEPFAAGDIAYNPFQLLGRGNYGSKLVRGSYDGKDVAVKIMSLDTLEEEQISADLEILKALPAQTNILKPLSSQIQDDHIYIASDLCNVSLQDEIDINLGLVKMSPVEIITGFTEGLAHLHAHRIVHGNLKPSNILFDKNNRIKISDFGLKRPLSVSGSDEMTIKNDYMAPEILKFLNENNNDNFHLKMTQQSDVFSLGCNYFFTLTKGNHPYGDASERQYNIQKGDQKNLDEIFLSDSQWLILIKSMTSYSENERPSIEKILLPKTFSPLSNTISVTLGNESLNPSDLLNNKNIFTSHNINFHELKILGEGSNGTSVNQGIYGDVNVAVKRLTYFQCKEIQKEINALKKLEHPNIVRLYAAELRSSGEVLLALELCSCTLEKYVKNRSVLLVPISNLKILSDITNGLNYVHSKSIVHRDLKPRNILLRVDGANVLVKIADFGISTQIPNGRNETSFTSSLGTPGWRAPEVIRYSQSLHGSNMPTNNEYMTTATDIFSLGCIFFYVLMPGSHPFDFDDQKILNNNPNPRLTTYPNSDIIYKMLNSDASKRPTASTILQDPLLWSNQLQLDFIVDMSNFLESVLKWQKNNALPKGRRKNKMHDPLLPDKILCVAELEKRYMNEICKSRRFGWFKDTCPVIQNYLINDQYTKQYYGSVLHLIRVIRNIKGHWVSLGEHIKCAFGTMPDGYMKYWSTRFPSLLFHMRCSFESLKTSPDLCRYYN